VAPNQIAANLAAVRARIAAAAARAGRDPARVRLVAVSKTFPAEAVLEACQAGQVVFGENRVQEAEPKMAAVAAAGAEARWHLIGTLQSNKAGRAVHNFAMIQSVDSVRIAGAIARRATAPVPILLEVNVAGESSKSGIAVAEVTATVQVIRSMPELDLQGLMTVAPRLDNSNELRPIFRSLARLAPPLGLAELSMGMSGDFEVAVEEGATIVRVGSAIFGTRTP
jgi:pyridoxal phosphate enzyme (YggS family)